MFFNGQSRRKKKEGSLPLQSGSASLTQSQQGARMRSLPILLTKPEILLIGGGKVALHKARILLKNDVPFTLIAPQICAELLNLDISIQKKKLRCRDLDHAGIIVDATGNPDVTKLIMERKKQYNFLFNCVDRPDLCDFYFSSLLNYGNLKIAVSTNGCSPSIGQIVRDKIATIIPNNIHLLLEDQKLQRKQGNINIPRSKEQCNKLFSTVYLIGCGPGDVDMLTMKAYRTIQQMDIILYDHLVTQEILDLIPPRARRIPVGKQKGAHSFRQEQINELILELAKSGAKIARLKSGDPYIFGRGAEEAEYLIKRGIRVEVISGISSAIAGPSCAGIPPTARGYATNMSIVSAHSAGNRINTDWLPLLKIPNHTTIVLMGLSFATRIAQMALATGVNKATPVAIVTNASRPEQQTLITDIEHLPQTAEQALRPAIIVIGDVVNLHQILGNMTVS
ncbi:MAG: uroporphyrinogen-III C-methyltransferase [Desulfuromusa sp.]|nr:uroporphyrinogen-III C-methyltransferase [Desulfuromusa sp.]